MSDKSEIQEFADLLSNYKKGFIYFAYSFIGDQMAAEDIVLESLMNYWENRSKLAPGSNIRAYILTVIKNKCLNYLQHQRTREEAESYIQASDTWELNLHISTLEAINPGKIFSDEIQKIVDETLITLPEQTRIIFMKSRYDNLSHKEIAEQMGLSTKSIEFHITKALKVLRIALKDYFPGFLLLLKLF